MTDIRCEEFEREFASLSDNQADPTRRRALEQHRQNCPFCRAYSAETQSLRTAMSRIPRLETSPQFTFNLRREINRLEHPRTSREMGTAPLPHSLAVSAGFVMAVILGFFLFLRPGPQGPEQAPVNTNIQVLGENNVPQPPAPVVVQPAPERGEQKITPQVRNDKFADNEKASRDTLKHHLPEEPGKDSYPVPDGSDFWRMDQVSTGTGP